MKKIVFIVLTLLLLAGLCIGIGVAALSADAPVAVNSLEQTIMEGYALTEAPADAKPVRSYGDFLAMDPNGTYYLTVDLQVTGSYLLPFEGALYGNGHTVTLNGNPLFMELKGANVYDLTFVGSVNNVAATKFNYVGALTRTAYNSTIVGITNKASIHQEIKEMFAGGVAGHAANTTIKYCVNYGTITGHADAFRPGGIVGEMNDATAWIVLENCINYGTVNGRNQTGGIMARVENGASIRMSDCANFGTVNVAGSDSGGLLAKVTQNTTEVTIERCYNSGTLNAGTIAGGVAGLLRGTKITISDCYNGCFVDGCDCEGTVHGYITNKASGDMGGIVANIEGNLADVTVTNCTNTGVIYSPTTGNRFGAIAGCMECKTLTVSNCHNYADITSYNYGAGLLGRAGASAGTLTVENCSNNGNVTSMNSYVGGIIGYQQYSLAIRMVNCVNNGDISSSWNAGGILCRMDSGVVTMTGSMEFINCVNNGNIINCSGTAGGILGILEPGDFAKIPKIDFVSCQNNGDITFTNYAGGITGIAQALVINMTGCTNNGNIIYNNVRNANEYGEIGGLGGRIFATFTATDCINTGNIYDPSTSAPSSRTNTFMLGGIVGCVGQQGTSDIQKTQSGTFVRCINTGIVGNSKAVVDAATTYAINAGGIAADVNGKVIAKYCINLGDIYSNQRSAGITCLAGESNVGGSTYEDCYVSGELYNSGLKTTSNTCGAAGLSCYVWGNANAYRCTVTSDLYVGTTSSGKGNGNKWICSAMFGYTNNNAGKFQYNYFTGTLACAGGDDCYIVLLANTRTQDVTSDEGGDIIHNYSVNQYPLHACDAVGHSASKSTFITPDAMKELNNGNFSVVTTCDGTTIPLGSLARTTFAKAQDAIGHTYGSVEVTNDPTNHKQVCACGSARYIKHEYENACDADCDICGYERTVGDHVGEFACSENCMHCGAILENPADHTAEYACSTTCQLCAAPISGADHTVDGACDSACNVCGEAVVAAADHTLSKPCDSVCAICGEAAEGVAHQGSVDCAPTCQWCGTAVSGAEHEGEYACSTVCMHCGTTITGAEHSGEEDCSTTCKWCGTTVKSYDEHDYDNACDAQCNICGESREVGAHEGAFECSVVCKHCGQLISPVVEHTAEYDCSTTCQICGAGLADAAAHAYENACDDTCNACGAQRATAHAYSYPCDAACNICGFERNVDHGGEHLCSNVCRWCEAEIEPVSPHLGLEACSEICKWCAGQVDEANRVAHTYDHNCDTVCDVCNGERTVAGHQGVYPCSDVCQWCEAPITNPGAHVYDNSCDASCNNCGTIRLTARHAFDNDCDPDCNKSDCDYVREVAHAYDNDCDKDCRKCGETRETQHVYDIECDTSCNVCGAVDPLREHAWDNVCDPDCNYNCGTTRETKHSYASICSGFCTKCEQQVKPDSHDVESWEVVTEPTADADGTRKGICSFCDQEVTESFQAAPNDSEGDASTEEKGNSWDIYILVIAAAALVVFNVIVILVISVKKKKAKARLAASAEEQKTEE